MELQRTYWQEGRPGRIAKQMFVLPVCTLTLNLYCHPKSSHDDMLPLISVRSWWHHISLTFFSYLMHKTKDQTTHYDAYKRTWQHPAFLFWYCIAGVWRIHADNSQLKPNVWSVHEHWTVSFCNLYLGNLPSPWVTPSGGRRPYNPSQSALCFWPRPCTCRDLHTYQNRKNPFDQKNLIWMTIPGWMFLNWSQTRGET